MCTVFVLLFIRASAVDGLMVLLPKINESAVYIQKIISFSISVTCLIINYIYQIYSNNTNSIKAIGNSLNYLIIVAKEGSVITTIKKNYNIFLYFIS